MSNAGTSGTVANTAGSMSGQTTGTTQDTGNTTQTASSQPWAQSIPLLASILQSGGTLAQPPDNSGLTSFANELMAGNGAPGYDRSGYVTRGLDSLSNQFNALNTRFGDLQGVNNSYQWSLPSTFNDYKNALTGYQGNYNKYQGQLQPYLDKNYTDPTKVPGIQSLLSTISSDIGNSVNSQFAGAGRDLSGMNTQSLARGIAQGEAPVLYGAYNDLANRQRGAQDALFGAGGALYGAGTGTTAAQDAARLGRVGAANMVFNGAGNVFNAGNTLTNAGNTAAGLLSGFAQQGLQNKLLGAGLLQNAQNAPLDYLKNLTSIATPIASLGQTSTGNTITDLLKSINLSQTGTQNGWNSGTVTASPLQDMLGVLNLFGGKK